MSVVMLLVALAVLAWGVAVARALGRITRLADEPGASEGPLPSITIACAGRDEGAHWERAVRSWLAQDVPELQVVVVDDRSRDDSWSVLERLAAQDPRVVALRVTRRPDGWLGKCHALAEAARHATGDFIVFTDADVSFAPGALRRAALLARDRDVDHLTLLPEVEADSPLQRAFTVAFFHALLIATRGDRANTDEGACFIGVGAFNMVRRSAYERAGGHAPIRMQVGDDLALARLMQRAGGRHRVLSGFGLVRLRWHAGVLGTMRGLEKNAFWGARLSVTIVLLMTAAGLLSLLPLAGLFAGGTLGTAAFLAWLAGISLPHLRTPAGERSLLAIPLSPALLVLLLATIWNSMLRTLVQGGVSWRGDLIPLRELRASLLPLSWWHRG